MPNLLGHHETLCAYDLFLKHWSSYYEHTNSPSLPLPGKCSQKPRLAHSGGRKLLKLSQYAMLLHV